MEEFRRLTRLPAYVFNITGELKAAARKRGEDIIDFGMGNPDGATPKHIVDKLIEAAQKTATHRYSLSRGLPRLRKAICNWYGRRYGVELDRRRRRSSPLGRRRGLRTFAWRCWTMRTRSRCRIRAIRSISLAR
jgi:alanine-synthesizing transaminase